jgi:hypothetical protein
VRKALSLLASPWHDARGIYLRHDHDGPDGQTLRGAKDECAPTIEILRGRSIKLMMMMLEANSLVRARAFGDGPDGAAVRARKQVRALAGSRIPESVPDLMTRS